MIVDLLIFVLFFINYYSFFLNQLLKEYTALKWFVLQRSFAEQYFL